MTKLNDYGTWYYVKMFHEIVHVHLEIILFLAESPELHDKKHISRFGGNFTSIRGFLFSFIYTWGIIHSYGDCYQSIIFHPKSWNVMACMNDVKFCVKHDPYCLLQFNISRYYSYINENGMFRVKEISN